MNLGNNIDRFLLQPPSKTKESPPIRLKSPNIAQLGSMASLHLEKKTSVVSLMNTIETTKEGNASSVVQNILKIKHYFVSYTRTIIHL